MVPLFLLNALLLWLPCVFGGHDYGDALSKSILFFEAQRSGHLPKTQRVDWRGDSALYDGRMNGVDLVGGYYDAGDNVKFGLPMAFTVTMLSWSVIEYRNQLSASRELSNAMDAIKWGTDYLLKANPHPNVLYGEVGDGASDHYCWQRPEDMSTSRVAYRVDEGKPGSDLAGETSAAMAAASVVFRDSNHAYSRELLFHAIQLFEFADKFRGKYDASIRVAQRFYQSYSGYDDELLWAAAWLYRATKEHYYLSYLATNGDALGGTRTSETEFGWDVKYAGVQVLVSQFLMEGVARQYSEVFQKYQQRAESFMCSCVGMGEKNIQKTPSGLIYQQRWNNLQFVTSSAFLLTVYSDYMIAYSPMSVQCPRGNFSSKDLLSLAQSQVDYILGDNPRATSYMVGYGNMYPQQVHHRASSIVSYKEDPSFIPCREGYATWFSRKASDPNVLVGAVVGGPDKNDNFVDRRDNFMQTEPATYNNAPFVGVLARLNGGGSNTRHKKVSPVQVPIQHRKRTPIVKVPIRHQKHAPLVEINQKVTAIWHYNGKTYYRYSGYVVNKSTKTLTNLKLSISNLYGPQWGLTKHSDGDSYGFPTWVKSLASGEGMEFVFINLANLTSNIALSSYTLN